MLLQSLYYYAPCVRKIIHALSRWKVSSIPFPQLSNYHYIAFSISTGKGRILRYLLLWFKWMDFIFAKVSLYRKYFTLLVANCMLCLSLLWFYFGRMVKGATLFGLSWLKAHIGYTKPREIGGLFLFLYVIFFSWTISMSALCHCVPLKALFIGFKYWFLLEFCKLHLTLFILFAKLYCKFGPFNWPILWVLN